MMNGSAGQREMATSMYDKMFDDRETFVKYFRENDTKENREAMLKTSRLCLWYCRFIEDMPEIRSGITESEHAFIYCTYENNFPEVARHITEGSYVKMYENWCKVYGI